MNFDSSNLSRFGLPRDAHGVVASGMPLRIQIAVIFALFLMTAALIFVSVRLVDIENQRYALSMGMCPGRNGAPVPDLICIQKTETRTSWIWHLWYGLAG